MEGRTLLDSGAPVTQSIEAVKALLAYMGQPSDPLPAEVVIKEGHCVLVLSNKKDAYYTVTERDCSCPSAIYRPGQPCKHQRKYFPQQKKARADPEEESLIKGPFKPVQPEYAQAPHPRKKEGPLWIDAYAPVTTPGEVEYWRRKEVA